MSNKMMIYLSSKQYFTKISKGSFAIIIFILIISCKTQKDCDKIIEQYENDRIILIEPITDFGDSIRVVTYIPKKYKVSSCKKMHLIAIGYYKHISDINTSALVLDYKSGTLSDTLSLTVKYFSSIPKSDFSKLTNQKAYKYKNKYKIENFKKLKSSYRKFEKDSLNFLYSYENERRKRNHITLPVNIEK